MVCFRGSCFLPHICEVPAQASFEAAQSISNSSVTDPQPFCGLLITEFMINTQLKKLLVQPAQCVDGCLDVFGNEGRLSYGGRFVSLVGGDLFDERERSMALSFASCITGEVVCRHHEPRQH